MSEAEDLPAFSDQPDRIRVAQRAEWAPVAPHWRTPDLSGQPPPIHRRLIELAEVQLGQRAVDLACGTGSAALLQQLGPEGSLLGLDLSPEMVAIAAQWAHMQRLPRATFRAITAETDLELPPASFDVATCIFGLMFMPEKVAALRSLREALVPGGRVAVCSWSTPDRCGFLEVPRQVVRRHVAHPKLDLVGPHPFALPTPRALEELLAVAGFTAIQTEIMRRPAEPSTPERYWESMVTTGWPLAFLPAQPPTTLQAIRDDLIGTLSALFPDGQVQLDGEAILAVASRPL